MTQTAVEWLNEKLISKGVLFEYELIEQAKAMEKEQIMHAYWNGTTDMEKPDALLMAEDYFNQYYSK